MFAYDKTTFPFVHFHPLNLGVGLLPVMWSQFEYFLGEPNSFSESTYREVIATSPRASWGNITTQSFDRVFVTGVQPPEVEGFLQWLGEGFRLPTDEEWRLIDQAFGRAGQNTKPLVRIASDPRTHPAARSAMRWAMQRRTPADWRTATLMDDGLMEWVRCSGSVYRLQGRPRAEMLRVIHNPQSHAALEPTGPDRDRAFGFRVVCPWPCVDTSERPPG